MPFVGVSWRSVLAVVGSVALLASAPAERKALLSGRPLTKLLPSDQRKEVFVFGAIWSDASPAEYVRRVKNIEDFEKGAAFRITKKISDPQKLEDFAELELPKDDVKDRRLALEYVDGYREGGNARLAVYRDADDPVFVANEFRSMIERAPSLVRRPELLKYVLEYPSSSLAGSTDFLYWQEARFGLKPTIRINHLVIQDRPDQTVIASKTLLASHYFWTALEERVLQPDPARGSGFWFVTISRSRSDGLKGFIGRLVRGRVRSEAQKGTEAALNLTTAGLEGR